MFNELPDIFKKEIKSEYNLRRIVVILVCFIFLQISFLIFILPSWLVSFYKQQEAISVSSSSKISSVFKNADNISTIINRTNQNLAIISDSFHSSLALSSIEEIISQKTSTITLSNFTYDNSSIATSVPMSISGVARTREDLVNFVKRLSDSGYFSNIVSPISDLTKDKNIDFMISLNTHM